MGHTDMIS